MKILHVLYSIVELILFAGLSVGWPVLKQLYEREQFHTHNCVNQTEAGSNSDPCGQSQWLVTLFTVGQICIYIGLLLAL